MCSYNKNVEASKLQKTVSKYKKVTYARQYNILIQYMHKIHT